MPISPRRAGASSPWRFSTARRTLIENASVRSLEQRTSRQSPTRWFGPTQGETLPREPPVAALHPWQTGVLDIADCDRAEFVIALQEDESAETRIETWPAEVRAFVGREQQSLPHRTRHYRRRAEPSGRSRPIGKSARRSRCRPGQQPCFWVIIGFSVNRWRHQKQCHQSALCRCQSVPLCHRSALVHPAIGNPLGRSRKRRRSWMDTIFPPVFGRTKWGARLEEATRAKRTIVVRSGVRLKRSEPFLARHRSYRHSRRRRNRAAPLQPTEPAAADQISVTKGRQSWAQLHQELPVFDADKLLPAIMQAS
jgi:hypothetical protein